MTATRKEKPGKDRAHKHINFATPLVNEANDVQS